MFFNVSDDLAMKNDPNSTYICAMSQSSQNSRDITHWFVAPNGQSHHWQGQKCFLAEINFFWNLH